MVGLAGGLGVADTDGEGTKLDETDTMARHRLLSNYIVPGGAWWWGLCSTSGSVATVYSTQPGRSGWLWLVVASGCVTWLAISSSGGAGFFWALGNNGGTAGNNGAGGGGGGGAGAIGWTADGFKCHCWQLAATGSANSITGSAVTYAAGGRWRW